MSNVWCLQHMVMLTNQAGLEVQCLVSPAHGHADVSSRDRGLMFVSPTHGHADVSSRTRGLMFGVSNTWSC